MSSVDELSKAILRELLADFCKRNLQVSDLHGSYAGASLLTIEDQCRSELGASIVDFKLAVKQLEDEELIRTGPMVPYENDPNSMVFVAIFFSKYEHASLTVKGYKAAQKTQVKRGSATSTQRVHISGSQFHNSQIGIGTDVTQSVAATPEARVYVELRKAIEQVESADDRARMLGGIDAMKSARTKPELASRYAEFVTMAANYITIISPFLPALSALLTGNG